MIKTCKHCKKEFKTPRKRIVFCSQKCYWSYLKDRPLTINGKPHIKAGFYKKCLVCGKEIYVTNSTKSRKYCSSKCSLAKTTIKLQNIDFAKRIYYRGSDHWNWKGGISKFRDLERRTEEHKAWRKAVFERDNYTCQECNKRGGYLNAHHIKPWALYPDLRYEVDNGLTVCKKCHSAIGHSNVLNRTIFNRKKPPSLDGLKKDIHCGG